ncbi:hypothetical protein LCGC14_1370320 [marine sediment metagenome]|uniref:Uncharacterized protein n=1 Tax=marine sediment metagenome TaxID=412755 RepID=A0A0F9K5P6_9ZZZZ
MADTTALRYAVHPVDRIFMEVSVHYCRGREYMPPVIIDVRKHALRKRIYDLNQRMAGRPAPTEGETDG